MADIQQLLEIARDLELQGIVDRLAVLRERQGQTNTELIIPLVGEFSSGKTSLLNALTDGKKLETAATPTTAVIFEVYFSRTEEKAIVVNEDGTTRDADIDSLKNSDLTDVQLVKVYDKSTRIPSSVVLVDTPGLSSLEAKHYENLVKYLPLADLILMVVDVNQGVTASILKFISVAELANRRIYLVITKCDEKPPSERETVRNYIRDNTKLAMENIVCVSARDGQVDELLRLIESIQKDKNKIVAEVVDRQVAAIERELAGQVATLLSSSKLSTGDLDRQINETDSMNRKMRDKINRLVSDLGRRAGQVVDDTVNDFNRQITGILESLAGNPPSGVNLDAMARTSINNAGLSMFNNFKNDIMKELRRLGRDRRNSEDAVTLPSMEELELSEWKNLSYNIDLSLPHVRQLNQNIAMGAKVVAAVGIAVAVVATAGTAAPALTAVGGLGTLVNAADTATDIASIASNRKVMKQIKEFTQSVNEGGKTIEELDSQMGQAVPLVAAEKQGFLEGLVSKITEQTHAKPQRERLISDYLSGSLRPEFRRRMEGLGEEMIDAIERTLLAESDARFSEGKNALAQLKKERDTQKSLFDEKIKRLESYRQVLPAVLPAGKAASYLPL